MNVVDVMEDVAAGLESIDGLRVFAYPAGRVSPPAAVVLYPEITYDASSGRGTDRFTVQVLVLVGMADQRAARDVLAAFLDGSGPGSVKAALESHEATSYDVATVRTATTGQFTSGEATYLGASFDVDIIGEGA